jgi:uncharacterized protein (DUF58 family)
VRQTAAPSPVRLWIGLHLGTAASKQADEAAISLAAGLVDLAIGRGMEVGFFAPQAGVVMKPREGRRQREQIFDRLARIDLDAKPGNPGWREAPLWSDAIGSESAAFEQGRVICIVVHSRTANEQWGPPKSVHIVAREFTSVPPVAIGAATVGLGTDSPEGSALNGHAVVRPAGVSTG